MAATRNDHRCKNWELSPVHITNRVPPWAVMLCKTAVLDRLAVVRHLHLFIRLSGFLSIDPISDTRIGVSKSHAFDENAELAHGLGNIN